MARVPVGAGCGPPRPRSLSPPTGLVPGVVGRLALESGKKVISHETIYRFIYAQLARKKDYSWRHYLPRAKSKRGWRGRKGGSPASFIHLRRPLAERPKAASDRHTPGHWEADLMLFRTYGQAILTLHERYSRILIAVRPPGKAASPIGAMAVSCLAWRQTITFDNGTEFARELHALGIETFFCDTYSPSEGRRRKRHRQNAALPAQEDRSGLPSRRTVYSNGAGVQQYSPMPRLSDSGRDILEQSVALQMESTSRPAPERRLGGGVAVGSASYAFEGCSAAPQFVPRSGSRQTGDERGGIAGLLA